MKDACLDGVEVQVLLELAADMMVVVLSFQYEAKVPNLKSCLTSIRTCTKISRHNVCCTTAHYSVKGAEGTCPVLG